MNNKIKTTCVINNVIHCISSCTSCIFSLIGIIVAVIVGYCFYKSKSIIDTVDTIGITMVKSWSSLVGMTGMLVTSLVLALILVTVLISIILSILNVVNTVNGIKIYNKDNSIEYLRKNTTHKIFLDIAYIITLIPYFIIFFMTVGILGTVSVIFVLMIILFAILLIIAIIFEIIQLLLIKRYIRKRKETEKDGSIAVKESSSAIHNSCEPN